MRLILETLTISIAYAFTGYLGQLNALPPGNVTFLWPPSGIALAAFLIIGNRAVPGVFIGALLINGWTLFTDWQMISLVQQALVSVGIGIGSILQPLAGKLLIDKIIKRQNPFSNIEDIIKFGAITLGISVVSASVGVSSLMAGNYVTAETVAFTWVTWWGGDFAGLLVFTPLITLLAHMSLRQIAIVTSIIIVGLTATNLLSRVLRSEANTNWATQAEQSAERITTTLLFWLDISYAPLKTLALIFESSNNVTDNEFFDATESFEDQEDGFLPDTIAFVRKFKGSNTAKTRYIVEYSTDTDGFLVEGSEVTDNPLIAQAIQSAETNASQLTLGALQLEGTRSALGIIAITVKNTEQDGYIIGTIGFDNIIGGLYKLRVPTGLYLNLRGRAGGITKDRLPSAIYSHPFYDKNKTHTPTLRTSSAQAELQFDWSIGNNFMGGPNIQSSSILLVGGSIVTLLISLFTLFLFEQNRKVQQRVLDRTAELILSERRLLDILKQSPMGVAISDVTKEGVIHYANPRFAEMFGLEVKDLIGAQANGLYANPEDRYRIITEFEDSGEVRNIEIKLSRHDGSTFWALISFFNTQYEGQPARMGWVYDITEMKNADDFLKEKIDELEGSNQELEVFNKVAVGRELRMIELKREINTMLEKTGQEMRYDLID